MKKKPLLIIMQVVLIIAVIIGVFYFSNSTTRNNDNVNNASVDQIKPTVSSHIKVLKVGIIQCGESENLTSAYQGFINKLKYEGYETSKNLLIDYNISVEDK